MIALFLLSILPRDDVLRDTVDLMELNHFYDGEGRLVFDQVIFYDWSDNDDRFNVRAWRMVREPWLVPTRDWRIGGYSVLWLEGDQFRSVHARSFRETWTQYDPEVDQRAALPVDRRRGLRQSK